MSMISYAQNGEDVRLRRAFLGQPTGYYVDVGAYDPVWCSITKHFYDKGWRGLNIEASPSNYRRVAEGRPLDRNVNVGVSDGAGTLTFYDSATETAGLSTFSAEEAARHRAAGVTFVERSIPVLPLAQVLSEHSVPTIDFMSIDVEGHEREVLLGADFHKFRPRVVIVEATRPRTTTPVFDKWEPLLLSADYLFAVFDGLNRYYVRSEDAALIEPLAAPLSPFDDFIPYLFFQEIERLKRSLGHYQDNPIVAGPLKATAWIKKTFDAQKTSRAATTVPPDLAQAIAQILGRGAITVVDVGARWGNDGVWYRKPPATRVYGFDPDEAECARLNAALPQPSLERFVPIALAELDGKVRLHHTREPGCSSIFEPNAAMARRYPLLTVIDTVGESEVSTFRLDTWARTEGIDEISFIKLDVQGAALRVLEGAGSLLSECLGLEIEVEFMPLYQGEPMFSDVDQWLRKRGFWVWRLDNRVHYSERHEDGLGRTDVSVFDNVTAHAKAGAGRLAWAHALYFRDYAELPLETRKDAERLLRLAVLLGGAAETDALGGCLGRLVRAPEPLLSADERASLVAHLALLRR